MAIDNMVAASGRMRGEAATVNVADLIAAIAAGVAAALPAGDNNIGNVDLASALPAGENKIGSVDIAPNSGKATATITRPANTTAYDAKDVIGTLPVAAAGVLTFDGAVIDGENVSIGDDVYEFDTDSSVEAGNIAVDVSASATKAVGTLTVDTNPTVGDKMIIGTKEYTFVETAAVDGDIGIGLDVVATQTAIVAAINGSDLINEAHPLVTAGAFNANASTITAIAFGSAGNAIATTETFTAETNVFGAENLATGADCSAANAVTALAGAITASDTQGVGGVDGTGDTVALTADTAGVAGNAITTTTTCANASFAAGTLLGGLDATYLTFETGLAAGSNFSIYCVNVEVDADALPDGVTTFLLHFYSSAPTAISDGAGFDLPEGDRAKYLGNIAIAQPVDIGPVLWSQNNSVGFSGKLDDASTDIYGILQTVGGWTPASGTQIRITFYCAGL
ncbi:MAG: hypothetical protein GX625_19790 [Clostridiaceae bacterium]|nr:hypothetical protein [Clostridiaceae bacterium]